MQTHNEFMKYLNRSLTASVVAASVLLSMPATAQLAGPATQGGVAPVYTTDTARSITSGGILTPTNSVTPTNAVTPTNTVSVGNATVPGTIVPLPDPYTHQAGQPNAPATAATAPAAAVKQGIPNEGEVGRDGKIVHYEMAGKDPGTGTGVLRNVQLPKRSFGDVDGN